MSPLLLDNVVVSPHPGNSVYAQKREVLLLRKCLRGLAEVLLLLVDTETKLQKSTKHRRGCLLSAALLQLQH